MNKKLLTGILSVVTMAFAVGGLAACNSGTESGSGSGTENGTESSTKQETTDYSVTEAEWKTALSASITSYVSKGTLTSGGYSSDNSIRCDGTSYELASGSSGSYSSSIYMKDGDNYYLYCGTKTSATAEYSWSRMTTTADMYNSILEGAAIASTSVFAMFVDKYSEFTYSSTDGTYTCAETTAEMNSGTDMITYYTFTDVEIKFDADGSLKSWKGSYTATASYSTATGTSDITIGCETITAPTTYIDGSAS